jgi:diacylglycerol kinase family enzyme
MGRHGLINRLSRGGPRIEHYTAENVKLSIREPFHYHADGELMESGPGQGPHMLNVSVVPEALQLIVPERYFVEHKIS